MTHPSFTCLHALLPGALSTCRWQCPGPNRLFAGVYKSAAAMAEVLCPLCVEGMDSTDLATDLCNCNFKVCLYCYNRICEEDGAQARCPNCRSVYDQERIRQQRPDPKQYATSSVPLQPLQPLFAFLLALHQFLGCRGAGHSCSSPP